MLSSMILQKWLFFLVSIQSVEIASHDSSNLIKDGRIHPACIEELVEKSRKEMDNRIREYGEEAAYEIGLNSTLT